MTQYETTLEEEASGWAIAGVIFAATMMLMVGTFQAIAGIAAIFEDQFYVRTPNYLFDLDVTAWGWIHLTLGVVLAIGGWALYARKVWAGVFALTLAVLSAIANFFFIPYYPWWSLLIIGIDIWIIWALTRPGAIRT
jgi:hypothetical protein